MFLVLFLLSEMLISGPCDSIFPLDCTGWFWGVATKIKIIALAFCKNHPVNFGSVKPYNRV